jgi:hypothetical protein
MEQLCFDSGLLQGRYLDFAKKAIQRRKQKKKVARDRLRQRLQANFSQVRMSEPTNACSAAKTDC